MDSTNVLQVAPTIWTSLIPVLNAIVVAMATLAGVFLANRSSANRLRLQLDHERQRKEEDKHASRLEELYVMIGHDSRAISSFYVPYLSATSGQVPLRWAREKSMESGFKTAPDQERLEMMFYLYYQQLTSDFDHFKAVVQDVYEKWSPGEEALEKGHLPTAEQRKAFAVAWALIDLRAKDLKKKVASLATRS